MSRAQKSSAFVIGCYIGLLILVRKKHQRTVVSNARGEGRWLKQRTNLTDGLKNCRTGNIYNSARTKHIITAKYSVFMLQLGCMLRFRNGAIYMIRQFAETRWCHMQRNKCAWAYVAAVAIVRWKYLQGVQKALIKYRRRADAVRWIHKKA